MTCWQCGAPLPPDAGFCRTCGAILRGRSAPATRVGVATPGAPQPPPPVGGGLQRPWTGEASGSTASPSPPGARVQGPPPQGPWSGPLGTGSGLPSRTPATPSSTLGDVVVMAATGGVLLSLLLTWYSVTITAVGMQFYQSLERALLYRLFPAAASGVGGLSGPLTISVSALSKEAGGWRWAILVVSIVLIFEVLLAIGSGVARQAAPSWPHATILLALCVVNLVLVGAAFFNLPYSDVPSSYISVSHGLGSYLGLGAALVALGGAVARIVRGPASQG